MKLARRTLAAGALVAATALSSAGPARAQAPPVGARVELTAKDGVRIAAFWYDCGVEKAPAVLLLHDNGRDHLAWNSLIVQLQHAGIHALAIDLRGHGASRALSPAKYQQLVQRDLTVYREMVSDAQAGVDYLAREKGLPPERIAVVGAELGSSIGFALMGANPKLRCLVALSPTLHSYGYQTLEDAKRYGKRPLLLLTTKSQYSEACEAISAAVKNSATVQVAYYRLGNQRGTAMLGTGSDLEHSIRNYVGAALGVAP